MDASTKRVYVIGLLVCCPYKSNPATCPLYDIRQKPVRERAKWVKQLTDEQIQDIINIHKECFIRRECEGQLS